MSYGLLNKVKSFFSAIISEAKSPGPDDYDVYPEGIPCVATSRLEDEVLYGPDASEADEDVLTQELVESLCDPIEDDEPNLLIEDTPLNLSVADSNLLLTTGPTSSFNFGTTHPQNYTIYVPPEDNVAIKWGKFSLDTQKAYEEAVRTRAYQLWEQAGRPEGRSEEFWFAAVSER